MLFTRPADQLILSIPNKEKENRIFSNLIGNEVTFPHYIATKELSFASVLIYLCPGSLPTSRPSLVPSDLGLLLLRSIDNGGAAHLSDFSALPVERPAANLVPQDVLEEEQPPMEAQG